MELTLLDILVHLKSPSPEDRLMALGHVQAFHLASAVAYCEDCLQFAYPYVRYAAADTLGQLALPQSIAALVASLADPDERLRAAAGWALVDIGRASIVAVVDVICQGEGLACDTAYDVLAQFDPQDTYDELRRRA